MLEARVRKFYLPGFLGPAERERQRDNSRGSTAVSFLLFRGRVLVPRFGLIDCHAVAADDYRELVADLLPLGTDGPSLEKVGRAFHGIPTGGGHDDGLKGGDVQRPSGRRR